MNQYMYSLFLSRNKFSGIRASDASLSNLIRIADSMSCSAWVGATRADEVECVYWNGIPDRISQELEH